MIPKNLLALRRIILEEKLSRSEIQVYFYLLGVGANITLIKECMPDLSPSAIEKSVAHLKQLGLVKVVATEGRSKTLTAVWDLQKTKE